MKKNVGVGAAAALAAALTGGCGGAPGRASQVSVVEWTSSFGFCAPSAYCTTRLRVEGTEAVLTLESRGAPPLRNATRLADGEADGLRRAAAQAHFDGLGPVVGCPDCADGGAETLSVTAASRRDTVTFEFGQPLDPLEPLLGRMRALAARLRPNA